MARSRDYSPDKTSDNDSAQNRLDAAEKRKQKKQAKKTSADPKTPVAFGSVLPPINFSGTRPDSRITVEPTVSDSFLDDSEIRNASVGQENMDEVLERKNYKEEEQEKAEIQAEKELYARLARVFPKEGVGGSTVTQDVLIRMFLKAHPDSHKFILYGRDGHLAKEIFSFFRGSNFTKLLNLKDFQKNEDAKRQAREYLIKNGVNLWENFTQKNSDFGTEKMFDDLERIRNSKDVPSVAESIRIDPGEDIQNDSSLSKKSVDEIRDTSRKNSTDHNRETNDALKNAVGNTGASLGDQQAEVQPEAKRGIDVDGIVEGLGVVGEATPEIVFEENGERKGNDGVSEKIGNDKEGGNTLEGEYLPEGEDLLQELRDRIRALKRSSDEARNRFFALRHRNMSKWLAVKKALFSSRSKELPESLVDEMEVLKSDWKYTLTLYKDAVVELAKREAMERKLDGKAQGALMAEAIRGLDVQGSIENYDAWKNASWGDREDSGFLRLLGRARDWVEEYRKLDWKKRVAISAVVVGTGVAGVAVGSAGLVGVGVAGSTIMRLLGAYGAGRGSYEFFEGRANQKTLQYHEAALSNVEKIEDIGFLEERMKAYADRTQKDLDRAIAGNRKRVVASVALGSVLFLGGTAFAHRGAIREFSGQVSHEFSKLLEHIKIITGLENFGTAPVSISGASVDQAVEVANATNLPAPEAVSPPISTPSSPEPIAPISLVEPGRLASGDAGVGVADGGQAAEVAGKIAKNLSETISVSKGSSVWETVRNYVMEHGGASNPDETEKMTARIVNNFVNTNKEGLTLRDISLVQPETRLEIISNPDNPRIPFKISSVEFAPVQGFSYAETPTIRVPSLPDVVEKIISPSSETIAPPNTNIFGGDLWRGTDIPTSQPTTIEPPDIFEKGVPEVVSAPSAHSPVPDFEMLNLAVPGSEYLKNVGTVVNEKLTFLPISQNQKDLIENIFSARIPTSGTEPTASSVLFVRDTLGKALFSSEDATRWMQADISEDIKRKVNAAVYAGIVRIGGESLRIGNMIAKGETVGSWLTKMARYILTHPIEIKK